MSTELRQEGDNNGTSDENDRLEGRDARSRAASYAWEYFKYHARQRQEVFRFYIVIVGALTAGYISSTEAFPNYRYVFGLLLLIISILFKRLDQRSHKLIKLAESYLKVEEQHLSDELDLNADSDKIKILTGSDLPANKGRFLATFRQIYTAIFLIGVMIGLFICYREGLMEDLSRAARQFCGYIR